MSILHEINRTVLAMCKRAQAPGFVPATGNEQVDAYANLGRAHLLRGVARGVKETIPGLVDGLIGSGAGLVNGAGQWLGGGRFLDGWDESKDFVRRHYSDPIRKAEMAVGGNFAKKMLDGAQRHHQGTIERQVGRDSPEYRDALETMAGMEGAAEFGTALVAMPAALGAVGKLGKVQGVVNSAGRLGWLNRFGNRLGATTAPFAGDVAVDSYRRWDDARAGRWSGGEDMIRRAISHMESMDPSSQEYRKHYDIVRKWQEKYPTDDFRRLRPPEGAM